MDAIVKAYLDVFIFLIFMVFAVQFLTVSVTNRAAESYLGATADRISSSHFSDDVITTCKEDAKKKFSTTEITEPLVVSVSERGTSGIKYGYAELTYNVQIKLFGINKAYTIRTDIR